MVPKCNIWNEEYHVIHISPDVYICTGRAWIATDPSTGSRTVPVKVYLDGSSSVGVVGEYAISVSLT